MTFATDNDCFKEGNLDHEVARILRATAKKIDAGDFTDKFQTIHDINGNDIGRWKLDDVN